MYFLGKKKASRKEAIDLNRIVYFTPGAGTGFAVDTLVAVPQSLALASPQVLAQSLVTALSEQSDLALVLALSAQSASFAAAEVAACDLAVTTFSFFALAGTF